MTNRHLQKQFLALLITLFVGTAVMAANTRSETVFYSLKLISIDGRTNVNSFWLRYAKIAPFRKIADIADVPHQQCDKAITVSIPAHDFVCSNHLMKNDFLSLIHANESPDINIQLQGFQGITNLKTIPPK